MIDKILLVFFGSADCLFTLAIGVALVISGSYVLYRLFIKDQRR